MRGASPFTGKEAGDRISSSLLASQIQLVLEMWGWKMSDSTLVPPQIFPFERQRGRMTHYWATLPQ